MRQQLKQKLLEIQKHPIPKSIQNFNGTILGFQNYFNAATHCCHDFSKLSYSLSKVIHNRLKSLSTDTGQPSKTYKQRYPGNHKKSFIANIALFQIGIIQHKVLRCFSQNLNPYSQEGRAQLKPNLTKDHELILRNPIQNQSVEYNDNRLSKWLAQKGRCHITQEYLAHHFDCHHIKPRFLGGSDKYSNLVIVYPLIHRLVHATEQSTIKQLTQQLQKKLDFELYKNKQKLCKLNILRTKAVARTEFELKL